MKGRKRRRRETPSADAGEGSRGKPLSITRHNTGLVRDEAVMLLLGSALAHFAS